MSRRASLMIGLISTMLPFAAFSEEPPVPTPQELIKKLEQDLTNVKLIGRYSVSGKEDQSPKPEEYTITSALKLPDGDTWVLKARIKYGDKDMTVPIPLDIKWAGDTPVITLTNLTIPQLGTFSARVVIYEGRYAGTWQHGKVGGHLFGRIEKVEADKQEQR
jgi:hypothetical protein